MAKGKKEEFLCLQCHQKVTENQHSVCCSICDRWIHKDCGLDDDEYKLIDKMYRKKGSHCWSCDGCSLGLSKLQKMIVNNTREINTLKQNVSDLEDARNKHREDIDANATKLINLEKDVCELKEREPTASSKDDFMDEIDLRESKKANLMIFTLPEPDTNLSNKEKKDADIETVLDVFNCLNVDVDSNADIKFIYRVGEIGEKPRPLSVGFRNPQTKDSILKNAWKLAKSKHKKVSLAPDLTPLQLQKEKKMFTEAEEKNKELSDSDAKNYIWKLVGMRGHRMLRKVKINQQDSQMRERTASMRRRRSEMEEEEEEGEGRAHNSKRNKRQC